MSPRSKILWLVSLTWAPLAILAVVAGAAVGHGVGIPLLSDYAVHARFLVSLPVLVAAEGPVWGRVVDLEQYLVLSGIVAEPGLPALERLVSRFDRLRRSPIIPVLAAFCVVGGVMFLRREFPGDLSTWQYVPGSPGRARTVAGWWYLLVSVPVLQFLSWYWALRYVLWCWFLYRLSRLDLALVPSHPDRSAGLRPVGQVHQYWALIVFALSALVSANVGVALVHGRSILEFRGELASFLGVSLVVLFAPFLVFWGKLFDARVRGLLAYGVLAADYTRAFDAKWVGKTPADRDLLGSSDIQSLADLANSYAVVRGLRLVPFETMNVVVIVLAVALPFVPLVFAVLSPVDAFKELVQILL